MEEEQLYNKLRRHRPSRSVRIAGQKCPFGAIIYLFLLFFFSKEGLKFELVQSNDISAWIF